MTWEMDVVDT